MMRVFLLFLVLILLFPAFDAQAQQGENISQTPPPNGQSPAPRVHRIRAQNAGELLYTGADFTIHENGNFLPTDVNSSGAARCAVNRLGTQYESRTAILVAIVDKGPDAPITRKWLWDNIRPPVLEEIVPKVCPKADAINVAVYIKGYDIDVRKEIYKTDEVNFPYIEVPTYTEADIMHGGIIGPNVTYRNNIEDYVSHGILLATFKGPAGNLEACSRDYGCDFAHFAPIYNAEYRTTILRELVSGSGMGITGLSPEKRVALFEKNAKLFDENANFNYFARNKKKWHEQSVAAKRREKERAEFLFSFQEALNKEVVKDGGATLFLKGVYGMWISSPCNDPAIPFSEKPWECGK